jgi:trigger factor
MNMQRNEEVTVSVESIGGLERRMTAEVPAERIESEVEKRLHQVAKTAKIKGFRPGKVPLKVIRQRYGADVRNEVVTEVVQSTWYEAVSEHKLRPVGGPRIETQENTAGADLAFTATFEVLPEIELKGHEGIAVERPVAEIEPADVDEMLEKIRKQRGHWHAVERAAESGDRVIVDFVGTIDGEEFSGGTGADVPVVLGEGRMLEDFEKGLAGMSPGEERDVEVKFPEDYQAEELAGKTAMFRMTAKRVEEEHLPELDDEFAQAFGIEEGGMDKLRSEVEANMRQEMAERVREVMKRQVLEGLLGANEVDLPGTLVEQEVQALRQDMIRRMGGQITDDSQLPPREPFEESARRRVSLGLLIGELRRSAEIALDQERIRARLQQIVSSYPNPEEVAKIYMSNRDLMSQLETSVLEEQVVDWLIERAEIKEKATPFKELMRPD